MNKKIYDLLKNEINSYTSDVSLSIGSNGAIFNIFDSFFHDLGFSDKISKKCGIKLKHVLIQNQICQSFNIQEHAFQNDGIGFIVEFDGIDYSIKFRCFKDGGKMIYEIHCKSAEEVFYSNNFIYKYFLYNALESSKLKGSYFSMPRGSFSWDIKNMEPRSFDDIFLPSDILEDLHLYIDIFKHDERLLRYLKVGAPGVGKTESTIVVANALLALGVTIIKTPICDQLHNKVELANVLAPCLIILDDIDLSLGDRNSGSFSKLLGDFLDVLDGTDKLAKNVGMIATTNAAHLLDLAAQRPGRFDKTLLFDNITKDNIKNIINKSLKVNFPSKDAKEVELYTNTKIVSKFFDAGVTGSHVFNSIKMLKLRYDTLKIKDVTVGRILKSIDTEIDVIKKVRKISFMKDKLDRESNSVGFRRNDEEPVSEKSHAEGWGSTSNKKSHN